MYIYIYIYSTPGGNTISAAEHTCTMMCAMARFVRGENVRLLKSLKYESDIFVGDLGT